MRESIGQQAKLTGGASGPGADGETNDNFGISVAIAGDTALVGAWLDDVSASIDQGSAYVYTRSGTTWTQQAKLVAADGAAGDQFGQAVALSGDTALVGVHRDDVGANTDQGSVYVYVRSGIIWTQQAKLVAGDGAANDVFGNSVALAGDSALVGAAADGIGANSAQGSAYVYTRIGNSWTQQAKLVAGDGAAGDYFGRYVALDGDTALVGALQDDVNSISNQGSAYVYTRSGTTWTQQAKLVAGDGAAGDNFGSVALAGDTALVGAWLDDVGAIVNQGSAYVYTRIGTTWTEQAKLVAADGAADDYFGYSVALAGDTAVVGAWSDDVGANSDRGSFYAYIRSGTTWTQQDKLLAGDGAAGDNFGFFVALADDTVLVGARFDDVGANIDQGSIYTYIRSGSTWAQQAKLTAGDGAADDYFGYSVAIAGDTALVGAPQDDIGANSNQGSAYVYVRSGTTWTQQAKLVAGDGAAEDNFGMSVALVGDTALVGALQDDFGAIVNQGSAYVYIRSGTTWTQQAKLVAADGAASDVFGYSVALDGDTAVVGAPSNDFGANGSAYVYIRSGTTWTQQAKLLAGDGAARDQFGRSVALDGDTALVGASSDDFGANTSQGSAYVYIRSGTTWTQQAKLVAADGAAFDVFGYSVALDGDTALVGALQDDVGAIVNQGSVYVYVRSGPTWTQQVKLVAGDGATNAVFGRSVVLVGNTALIGAIVDNSGASARGSAYVYIRRSNTWSQQARLLGDGAANFNNFAGSLALVGDTALVGASSVDGPAPFGNASEGAAYVYYGVGLDDSATTITSALPDPSLPGQAVSIAASVTGVTTTPADGGVTVTASTGESCVDPTPTAGSGTTAYFGCPITFATVGLRTLTASFSGSITHTGSTSAAAPHAVNTVLAVSPASLPAGVFGATYSQTVSATGNGSAPPYAYSVTSGTLPDGLALGGATGILGGTSSATGTFAFAITAVDSSSAGVGGPFSGTRAYSITIARANQAPLTATASPSTIVFAGTSMLSASGGSGTGAVIYFVTAGASFCSVTGATLTGIGVGSCTVTAIKVADANYNAANATVNITVVKANQATLTASASPSSIPFGQTSTLGTTGGSGTGAVTYAVTAGAGFCSVTGITLTATGVGTCTVTATKAADANYNPATATVNVIVQATQATLTASASPSSVAFGQNSTLSTTGGSGTGAVSYAVTAGASFCSVTSATLSGTGVGTCTITATKAADSNYTAATATVDVAVVRATQATLTATASPSSIAFGQTSTLGTAGGSGSGAVTYAASAGTSFCSVTGATLTGTGVGACTVTATKAADANYNAATATVIITVAQATQAMLMANASPASIAFGQTSTLGTTGGSGAGAVTYAVTIGGTFCSVTGITLTGTGVGTCTVTATKAADANYFAAIATVQVEVLAAADLEISKNDGTLYAVPGGFVEYQILVGNAGPLAVQGARVQDPVPIGLANAFWTCTPVQGTTCPTASGTASINQLVDLPVNAVLRYVISANVTAPLGSTITNTATVMVPDGTVETDTPDNTSSDVNTVVEDGLFANGFETTNALPSVPMLQE